MHLAASKKGADADSFIRATLAKLAPTHVCIDAPLSLPLVYRNQSGKGDYFYRACDRELRAMSPLFLGGLTARGMRIAAQLHDAGCAVYEVYPSALVRLLHLPRPKSCTVLSVKPVLRRLAAHLPAPIDPKSISSLHHLDAVLALLSAYRIVRRVATRVGAVREGVIYL